MQQEAPLSYEGFSKQLNAPLTKDSAWYLVDKVWFSRFMTFLKEGDESLHPGPIDNSKLFKTKEQRKTDQLKEDLVEDQDYVLVPESCWSTLKDNFGFTIQSLTIERHCIEGAKNHFVVEVYPLKFKLCLYGGKERTVEVTYSRMTPWRKVMEGARNIFNIKPDKETKLWIDKTILPADKIKSENGTSKKEENSSNQEKLHADESLQDVGAKQGSVVTLETMNDDGTWPSSKPKFGSVFTRSSKASPGLCGLTNMGNTCFMNSALQCLSNTPVLTNYILEDKYVNDINLSNPLGMHGEIARTYSELVKLIWSGNCTSFMPKDFKCAVGTFAPQFTGFAQQDCQELMAFLLDGLHEDLNRIRNKPYIEIKNEIEKRPDEVVATESWSNYKKRNDSIVVDTFHALLKSTLVCPGCNLVSVTFDPFCYLSLPLPVKRETQVSMVFLPRLSPIDFKKISRKLDQDEMNNLKNFGSSVSTFDGVVETSGCYLHHNSQRPKSCKIHIPRSGPVGEICDIVSRVIADESQDSSKLDKDELIVVELYNDKISRVYEPAEHYTSTSDEIVVIEKKSTYVVPVYIRERANKLSVSTPIMPSPVFLHVSDMKFETIYTSLLASLSNLDDDEDSDEDENGLDDERSLSESENDKNKKWVSIQKPGVICENNGVSKDNESTDVEMVIDGDGDDVQTNSNNTMSTRQSLAFELAVVNSSGNSVLDIITPTSKDRTYTPKLYLAATFSTEQLATRQFKHLRRSEFGNTTSVVTGFVPKVVQKPTLQLRDCITQFTSVEKLGKDDPWYCPACKKHQQATKKFDIWSLPNVLIIHLKRFSFSRSWRDKIDTLVEFPLEDLDMSSHVHDPEQKKEKKLVYNLIAVANHYGGLGGGHYTAYAKNSIKNRWYTFDDALVTPISADSVVTRSAYVLFYQLQD